MMTQQTAQAIIAEASQNRRILAELDTRQCVRYKRGGGYRVKLTLKPEHRVLVIIDAQDWEPIQQAWNEVVS